MEHFVTKKPLSIRVNTIEKWSIISFTDKSLFCKIMKSLDEQIETDSKEDHPRLDFMDVYTSKMQHGT